MVEDGVNTGVMLQGLQVVKFTTDKIGDAIEEVSNYVRKLAKKADQEGLGWAIVGAAVAILAIVALFALVARKE